jgi:hypothetical protein
MIKNLLFLILITVAYLNQTFCVDNNNNEEFFKKIYTTLGAMHTKEVGIQVLNEVLANPEVFQKERSTDQIVARCYFTVEFLALSKENFETVIKANAKTFKETLFGKSLMLGWALHNNGYDLSELFRIQADVKYGDFYKDALSNVGIPTTDEVIDELNTLDKQKRSNFYFETVHLAWPSKELRSMQLKHAPLQEKEDYEEINKSSSSESFKSSESSENMIDSPINENEKEPVKEEQPTTFSYMAYLYFSNWARK